MSAYCTVDRIQNLMARHELRDGTKPNPTQIEAIIEDASAEVEMYLASSGYDVPVTAPANFLAWVGLVVQYGSLAAVLKSMFPEAQTAGDNGAPVIPAYAFWEKRYQGAIKMILDRKISIPGAGMGNATLARNYLTDNPDNDPTQDGDTYGQQPYFSMQKEW